jgi:short subunit dehydrogenase-like uncharacterized protein
MQWMIYGANGYTGELIAREAVRLGMQPILAGRSRDKLEPLASELDLETRVFNLDDRQAVTIALHGVKLVLHCAGPFSATSAPMIEGCLEAGAHYLDITGEAPVFEHTLARAQADRARAKGVVLCSGVGFDVIPTDCVALKLKQLMADATHLSLGFDTSSGLSPGTSKTAIEGLGQGCLERRDGVLVTSPMGSKHREIDFGRGKRYAMAIPWGDVSTAYHTTGIGNIDTWFPMPKSMVIGAQMMNLVRPLMATGWMQALLKNLAGKYVKGPDEAAREKLPTYVWGEARNAAGETRTVRIKTANGYSLTVDGALTIAAWLMSHKPEGGSYTPAMLLGAELVEKLPGSGKFSID